MKKIFPRLDNTD